MRALEAQGVHCKGGDAEGKAEEVKASQVELPKLVVSEQDKEISPLIAGDWLTVTRDLSANGSERWSQVTSTASEHYRKWLKATPAERLSLRLRPGKPHSF